MKLLALREGEYTKGFVPITGGVFDIPRRLKEIDERFFVMYNIQLHKYEVHVAGQANTLGCILPFDELDPRAVEYVRQYSAARTEQNAREIEEYNARLEKEATDKRVDTANMKMKEAYRYLDHHESAESIPKELIEA